MLKLQFIKNHVSASLPSQSNEGDAGYDIKTIESKVIYPHCTEKFRTGLVLANVTLSDKYTQSIFLHLLSRSGLASKSVFVLGGVVDMVFRNEIMVLLHNAGDQPYLVNSGDRIAQMVNQVIMTGPEVLIEETNTIVNTARGGGGFGSTGR
jgi:dUTP pyrophosphatase